MAEKVTKTQLRAAIKRVEQSQDLASLQTGAELLGREVSQGEGEAVHYLGGTYPDMQALAEELVIDLGIRLRSL